MPDHITTRVEPQAPSREVAIALMRDIADRSGMGDPWSCDSDITESWIKDWTSHIDAHTAAKDAEIERWKREALLARPLVFHGVNRGTCDRLDWESLRKSHEAARAANGATP